MSALIVIAGIVAAPGPARANDDRAARDHYQKGVLHYSLGEFDQAISEFKQAYTLLPAPALLFDLAQAHRLKRDPGRALHFYRSYLRLLPDAKNRADVQILIGRLETEVQKMPAARSDTAIEAGARLGEPPAPAGADVGRGRAQKIAGTVVAGGGLALVATGVYFGHQASSAQDQIADLAARRGQWAPQFQTMYEDGQHAASRARIFYLAGGITVAAGGALVLLGWHEEQQARRVALAPAAGGAALSVSGSF